VTVVVPVAITAVEEVGAPVPLPTFVFVVPFDGVVEPPFGPLLGDGEVGEFPGWLVVEFD
jgi:hypothetical protein